MDEEEETELRNPFPSPPSHYSNYTSQNLKLLSLLRDREAGDISDAPGQRDQKQVLADQSDIPDWPLKQLEKPRVDWILEEGDYTVFGDTWFVKESIPSLGELGGNQLYPADPTVDRRPALLSILRSLLSSYSSLLKSLLAPPPSAASTEPPEWQGHIEWMTVMAQNIMSAANDLRPVQARYNLEAMMKRQLELRKQETSSIHSKCDELQQKLQVMKALSKQGRSQKIESQEPAISVSTEPAVNMRSVLEWAESA